MPAPAVVVKKFGGTSVGSIERIEMVADRVRLDQALGQAPIVVVSAMAGETNRLVGLANAIDPANRGPAYDMLVASGEQVSVALLSLALAKRGLKPKPLLAFQLGIQTDKTYSKARIQNINGGLLRSLVTEGFVPVIAGFQGVSEDDEITTLGRGGSDTTAVAVAAAIQARECEIYTDVPAVYSADPRLVPQAREIPMMSWEEMIEMASLGSKVLHIRSVEIAAKYNIRLHLRSSFESRPGTWVVSEGEGMEHPVVSSVTHEGQTSIFKLFPAPAGADFLEGLFAKLSQRGVVVDIITQSDSETGARVAFSVNHEDQPLAQTVLSEYLSPEVKVEKKTGLAKISIVGVGMRNHPGVAARFFKVFAQHKISLHLVTTSEIKVSGVIDEAHLKAAAMALHTEFGLDKEGSAL